MYILLPEGGLQIVRWANLITRLATFSDPLAGRREFCYRKNSACPIGPDRLKCLCCCDTMDVRLLQ